MELQHDSSSRAAGAAAGAVALLGLVTHTGPRHSTSLLAATGTWQVPLSAHETLNAHQNPPSSRAGGAVALGARDHSVVVEAQLELLRQLFMENCRF